MKINLKSHLWGSCKDALIHSYFTMFTSPSLYFFAAHCLNLPRCLFRFMFRTMLKHYSQQ